MMETMVRSANITLTGILSHESALKNGEIMRLPDWSFTRTASPV